MTLLVTGGAGFVGSNFVLDHLSRTDETVVNLDKLTYAGNVDNLASLGDDPRHVFVHGDLADRQLTDRLLAQHRPRAIVHIAAESHVDRSIHGPEDFIQTNIVGTFRLLEAARTYWQDLPGAEAARFRFLYVSTDEVYGGLLPDEPAAAEARAYRPSSPYSASKAAGDHLVRAWHHTYGLPTLITHCSNNYGPYQFPEKLIPFMIVNALAGRPLPLYGDGLQVRDWLYVGDHCSALGRVLEAGRGGETYNIASGSGRSNLDVVRLICDLLDELHPAAAGRRYGQQIAFVVDRPGHDRRYALDAGKVRRELGWAPAESFETGLRRAVQWCLENRAWLEAVQGTARYGRPVGDDPRQPS